MILFNHWCPVKNSKTTRQWTSFFLIISYILAYFHPHPRPLSRGGEGSNAATKFLKEYCCRYCAFMVFESLPGLILQLFITEEPKLGFRPRKPGCTSVSVRLFLWYFFWRSKKSTISDGLWQQSPQFARKITRSYSHSRSVKGLTFQTARKIGSSQRKMRDLPTLIRQQ